MAKQLNVNLAMTADTSKAKAGIQDLQKQLDNLMLTAQKKSGQLGISQDIQKATALAAQLKVQLESATSATGNLDLTKFNEQLRKSGTTITDYRKAFQALGTTGTQTFSNLASAIMKAEVPLKRTNARMQEFLTTLKNTARWQISSSILHGFMGALQGAYGYAQDLNESLNNIRIVTGQSVDQMAQFAEQANRAAKELSTTTTAYTDAALIYYQQGLGDKAVKERTDVTMKLANVSRQSAEEVSSQMTAIWNNFDDGTKSLEYYADVITKLGASTAASSAEISDGIQKFAAVADTVGLSYEKATAALATVVAETRQSADVVGTAFKTLFARVQGLNLGETLEDGVTLNKYSKALETVGVNILTANGELKNMDSILDELGERWNAIGEEQKVALAETVAGTRQYAQFMAIMENYDKILVNQQVAAGSEGTLQKQQEIFAESWEAASKRVKAAAQSIYSDLLDDKFFITVLNGFEKILKAIDNFIDGIGGLKTLIPLLGSIFMQVFEKQIQGSIRNAVNSLAAFTAAGRQQADATRREARDNLMQLATSQMGGGEGAGTQAALTAQSDLYDALREKAQMLNEEQLKEAQYLIDINNALGQEAIEAGKAYDAQKQLTKEVEAQLKAKAANSAGGMQFNTVKTEIEKLKQAYAQANDAYDKYTEKMINTPITASNVKDYANDILAVADAYKAANLGTQEFKDDLDLLKLAMQSGDEVLMAEAWERIATAIDGGVSPSIEELTNALIPCFNTEEEAAAAARKLAKALEDEADKADKSAEANRNAGENAKNSAESIRGMTAQTDLLAQSLQKIGTLLFSVTTLINGLKNLGNIWSDDDLTTGEKIVQTMSALAMILPTITTLLRADNVVWLKNIAAKVADATATSASTVATGMHTMAVKAATAANAGFLATLLPLLAAIWPIIAALAALAAVIYVFVKAAKKAQEASLEGQLKQSKEEAKKLTEELDKINDEIDELHSKVDTFDSLQEKIQQCEKGSQDWYNTLYDINSMISDLLQTYPELADYIEYDENGVPRIKQEGFDVIEQRQQQERADKIKEKAVNAARTNNLEAQRIEGQLQNLLNTTVTDFGTGGTLNPFLAMEQADLVSGFLMKHLSDIQTFDGTAITGLLEKYLAENTNLELTDAEKEAFVSSILGIQPQVQQYANDIRLQKNAGAAQLMTAFGISDHQDLESLRGDRNFGKALRQAGLSDSDIRALLANKTTGGTSIDVSASLPHLAEFQERIADLNKAIKSLATGDTIDLEAYEKLSDQAKSYFAIMEDGTYKLTVSVKTFQDAVFAEKSQGFIEALKNYQQSSSSYSTPTGDERLDSFVSGSTQAEEYYNIAAAYAMSTDNLEQLQAVKEQLQNLNIREIELDRILGNALIDIGLNYETCAEEISAYQTALAGTNIDLQDATRTALEFSVAVAEAAEQTGFDAKVTEEYAKRLEKELTPSMKENKFSTEQIRQTAINAAIANQRLDRGLTSLNKNLKDYQQKIVSANRGTVEWSQALDDLKTDLGDVLNLDASVLTDEFVELTANSEDLQLALDGDVDAILRLQEAAADAMVSNIAESLNPTALEDFTNAWAYLKENMEAGIESGEVDQTDLINSFNTMIAAGNMTREQIEAALSGLHVGANVKTNYVETETQIVPTITKHRIIDSGETKLVRATAGATTEDIIPWYTEETTVTQGPPVSATTWVPQYEIEGTTGPSGVTQAFTAAPPPSVSHGATSSGSSGGGGGGGKSSTQASKTHKNPTEEKERYHLLNQQLEDLSREYDKAGKAKDRLFGANKIRAINEEIKALDKLIAHNQSYLKAIEAYRKKDRAALVSGGLSKEWVDSNGDLKTFLSKGVGNVQFDKFGNVENYDAIIEHAVAEYNAAVDAYNQVAHAEGVAEEDVKLAEDIFKQAEMQYELTMEALQQYEETNNKFQEKIEEIRESVREQQDKRFEEWSYKLELKIKINDEDKRYLEYFRKHLEHFAKDAFAPVTELLSIWNNTGAKSDWTVLQQGASDLKSATEELLSASHGDPIIDENTGAVLEDFMYSQADWMQGLDDCEDKIYAQIDALYELDETMTDYYANTLSEAEAQLDKYIGKIEDCTAVLKHYQSVLELLSKEVNYEWMGEILTAQRDTVKQEMLAAKTEAEYAAKQYETMLARYEATKNQVDEGTRQKMEDELQAQYESMTKWQDAMLTKTEEFAQACIAVYENMIKKQSDLMEKALTNGQGFDSMLSSLERVSSYQDMMLTKTNQIYGTNKLMRQLSQDIDKTDSSAHKTKLANFRQEIEDMQNMNEMSKFDLDVANARYEVLKAQIALEDAQNAKSIVRLQRDNEGNYGYVYTADRDKMNNAQQELEDKQNDLYNLTLNKANEAAEALIKLDQEFVQTMEEIALQYQGNEAKIQEEQQRALEEYLRIRSQWVNDATTADYWQHVVSATQTNEAYKVAYQENLADMEAWHDQGMEYIKSTQAAHTELTDNMKEYVAPVIGESLDELREKTNALRQDSEKYQQWFDNFAATNASRLDQIAAITHEYYLQRQEVEALISSLEELVRKINEARAAEAAGNGSSGSSNNEPADWSLEMYRTYGTDAYAGNMAGRNNKMASTGMSESQYIYDTNTIDKIITEIHSAGMESWFENTMGSSFANIKAAARAGNDPFVELLKKKITGLFSGGYTGEWGPSGKLAFLHEKELVLNAQDTDNLLSAINLVRELNSMIDLRAASSSFNDLLRSPSYTNSGAALEQIVTIQAEFPNAVNHYEIEEAFNTLINRASQYANRK